MTNDIPTTISYAGWLYWPQFAWSLMWAISFDGWGAWWD